MLWVLSNMMLADWFRGGNYQILTGTHSMFVTDGVQHPRKKKGDKWLLNNKGHVTGDRHITSKGSPFQVPFTPSTREHGQQRS